MNQCALIGRVTKDIELRYTQNQKAVARFTLAVDRRKSDDDADFISCIAWNKTAEIMEKYVHKGDQVGVSGHIRTGSYEKDGHKVYTTDVIVEELKLLGGKRDQAQQAKPEPKTDADGFMNANDIDEDLPFN